MNLYGARIETWRERMRAERLDVTFVPTADRHGSEYLSDHDRVRAWLCGFTGSAGTLVVGLEEAALFTDGRYFIQAERELSGSGVRLMRMGTPGTPTAEEYAALSEEIPMGRLGRPEEVAELVLLLAKAPLYLTGQTIRIDGGWI